MGGQFFSVACAFDDDLIAGISQAIEGAVAQYGVIEEPEPFFHCPVAGNDEAGVAVAGNNKFVDVC